LALVAGGVAAWGAAGASGVRGVAPATVSLPPGVTELLSLIHISEPTRPY